MTADRSPFTYLIGWTALNAYYYGARTAKGCHPKDLWTTYFTSSKYVRQFRLENGEPDIIEVRKVFSKLQYAANWEAKVLRRMHAHVNKKFINRSAGPGNFCTAGTTQTEKYYKAKNKYYKVMDQKGNITIVNGMAAFCINNGLCKSSMSSVAKGKSRQYDGWQCRFIDDDTPFYPIEEITSRHKDGYVLLDYSGNKYLTDNLESFCQNHGISAGHLAAVAIGSEMHSKGWQCRYAGDNRDFYDLTSLRVRHSGKYKVKSPEGKEFIVSSLRGFSLKNGLHPAGMNDVCRGLYNQHRGWSVSYV